jgi:hypothetical protein
MGIACPCRAVRALTVLACDVPPLAVCVACVAALNPRASRLALLPLLPPPLLLLLLPQLLPLKDIVPACSILRNFSPKTNKQPPIYSSQNGRST